MVENKTEPSSVVVGDTKVHTNKKFALIGGAVAVALLLVVGGIFAFILIRSHAKAPSKPADPYVTLQQQTAELENKDDYAQKAKVLEDYLANGNLTQKQRVAQSQQLASAYMKTKDYQKALDTFKQTENDPAYKLASITGQASCYEHLGDKQKAIEMHKKAIETYKSMTGRSKSPRITIEETNIKRLESEL